MATIGLDMLYFAKITEDENGEETYGTPEKLAKAISADLSVELVEAILYADDGIAEIVKEFGNGTLSLGIDDIGSAVADIEKSDLSAVERAAKRDEVINEYSIKSERVHTVHQLLKAYAMFEKDVEYVVMDNKVKIVDEQTGRILEGRRYSDSLH